MRTAHSQSNHNLQNRHQRLEVRGTIHATNISQRSSQSDVDSLCPLPVSAGLNQTRDSTSRTSRTPGCQFDLPMKFYTEWIQQGKVPPDQTPSVPVIAQTNCPVKVELDDEDVKDQFPASAIGILAESTPGNSTRSNPGDKEQPSASPVTPVSVCVTRADTAIPASNYNGRPDKDNAASHPSDQAIYSDVQVLQSDRDSKASHNGVPVTSECYNDVRTSKVRVQGASPPAYPRVLQGRAKGRTSSTPSAQFVYPCIRRSDTASFRSTSTLNEKSKSDIVLGRTIVASRSNSKFDVRAQSVRCSTATPENSTFPGSLGYALPSQFDIFMSDSGHSSDKVESSATTVFKTPVMTKFDQSNRIMATKFEHNGHHASRSITLCKPSATSSTAVQQMLSVRTPGEKFACSQSQYCNCSTRPFASCVNRGDRDRVPFPRSNLYPDARRIRMDQSEGRIHDRAARTFTSQSQLRVHTATDQSGASYPGSLGYKRRRFSQFVSLGPLRAEDRAATNSASRNILSSIGVRLRTPVRLQQSNTPVRRHSAGQLSNTPVRRRCEGHQSNTPVRCHPVHQQSGTPARRQQSNTPVRCQSGSHSNIPVRHRPSSQNLILTYLLWSLWNNCRVRRQRTRQHKFQRSDLMGAMYVAMRIWSLPLIGNTCCRIIRWMWSGLLWCMTPTSTSVNEPNFDT